LQIYHIFIFAHRYVTFDQEDKGGASTLYRLLPTPQRMAKMVEVLILTKDKKASRRGREDGDADAEVDDLDELEDAEDDADFRDSASSGRSGDASSRRRGGASAGRGRVPAPAMGWRIGKKRPSPADKIVADWKKATGSASKAGKNDKRASGWEKPSTRGGMAASRDGAGLGAGAGKDSYTVAHVPSQKTIDEDAEVSYNFTICTAFYVRLLARTGYERIAIAGNRS
jgi:hypothetical protein